jgi:hypothetical protein
MENNTSQTEIIKSQLHTVTPLLKYLAMGLFIALPFLGGWIGYTYSPEKIVEVEKIITKTENLTTKTNRFIGNPEYHPVREYKKIAYIVDISSTSITLDNVDDTNGPPFFEIVNEEIDPITYTLNDTPFFTSARGPVTLDLIQTNPGAVSAPVNALNQPLAEIEFVTYENSSGVQIDVVTVVRLSFSS